MLALYRFIIFYYYDQLYNMSNNMQYQPAEIHLSSRMYELYT